MHGKEKECIQSFGVKTRYKLPLRRPRHRWEDNFKMGLRENGQGGMDWILTFNKLHIKIQ
jgi:hypothetical protein